MINNFILAQGQKSFYYSLGATIFSALFLCSFLTTLLAIWTILLVYIYRNPKASMIKVDGIVSPTDGVITAIDKIGEKQTIYVSLSLCDTHVLRAPIDAKMKISKVRHGLNLCIDSFKAKQLNTLHVVKFDKIKIALLSGRFNCITALEKEDEYPQNKQFAVMTQGEIKITLPKKVSAKVNIGQKVCAGKTILA